MPIPFNLNKYFSNKQTRLQAILNKLHILYPSLGHLHQLATLRNLLAPASLQLQLHPLQRPVIIDDHGVIVMIPECRHRDHLGLKIGHVVAAVAVLRIEVGHELPQDEEKGFWVGVVLLHLGFIPLLFLRHLRGLLPTGWGRKRTHVRYWSRWCSRASCPPG